MSKVVLIAPYPELREAAEQMVAEAVTQGHLAPGPTAPAKPA